MTLGRFVPHAVAVADAPLPAVAHWDDDAGVLDVRLPTPPVVPPADLAGRLEAAFGIGAAPGAVVLGGLTLSISPAGVLTGFDAYVGRRHTPGAVVVPAAPEGWYAAAWEGALDAGRRYGAAARVCVTRDAERGAMRLLLDGAAPRDWWRLAPNVLFAPGTGGRPLDGLIAGALATPA